jgi:electron transfer flavoprotein alpha subunit
MSMLVFLESHGIELQKGSLGVLAKAASLGDADVAAAIAGDGARALAAVAGTFGAAKVWVCEDAEVAQPLPQPRVDVLAQVVEDGGYDTVLFANSVLAADVAAGLAARLDAGLNWDLVDLELRPTGDGKTELVGKRPALQDSVYADVGWTSTPQLALFRAGSFDATPATGGGEPEIVDVSLSYAAHSMAVQLVGQDAEESSGPSIEDADVIVAGGRGLGSPDNFTLAEELAKALGGAVGATRAVVDAGWYPYSAQIGQTGKTVSPKLYVALGISGAIQHKVGMQSSGTIVAINKDANAPIFEFSDLGVVGDVHSIVPKLTELINARRG